MASVNAMPRVRTRLRCAQAKPSAEPQSCSTKVTRSGPATARADGLLVHWSSGLRSGTVRIDAHLVLCTEADTSATPCESLG